MPLTPRQRILAAMNHQATDLVPLDIGGTKTTSLNWHAYDNLKAHLGLNHPTVMGHWRSQRTHMAEELSRRLGSDVRRVHVPYPDPLPAAVTATVQTDEWGNEWTQAPTGLYFVSRSPLETADTAADLAAHPWPDPATLVPVAAIAQAAARLRRETDCAICLDLMDGVVHQTQFLRGFEKWLTDTADNQPLFERLLDCVTDIYVAMVGPLLDAVGEDVDLVLHCDDIAGQSGPLISPRVYRKAIKPRQARIFAAIKAHTRAKLLYHSCGSIYWALNDLADMGVDGINPVQVSAGRWTRPG